MTCKLLAAVLVLSGLYPVYGAGETATLLTEPPPKTAGLGEVVTFSAKDGYHFNLKAPQECGASDAFDVTKRSLKCKFGSAGGQDVSLKICDDNETSCMFEDFTVLVEGPSQKQAGAPVTAPDPSKDVGLEGFLLNAPAAALEQAKKEHKLLFIDFFGRWCPPCRVMEDTVLTQPAFLDATRGMVRVSLDVDRPEVKEWRSRLKPSGYPTYLIADPDLNEIGRWSGSGNLAAFVSWLKDQERWKDQPIEKVKAAAASLDEAGKLRVARNYMDGGKWAEVRKVLAGMNTRSAAYLDAQAQVKETASTDPVKMGGFYLGLIDRFDGHDGQAAESAVLDWIAELQKLDPAAAKPYLAGLDALIARLNSSKDASDEGYTPADVLYQAAEDMQDAGQADLSKGLYLRAAQAYADMAAKAARPELAKGLRLSQGRCLMSAGRYSEGADVYGGLAEKFPAEYIFHRSYAGALLELKKYPEALKEASLAVQLSYGDIHFNIVMLKAKIEMAQKDKPAAIRTLRAELTAAETAKTAVPQSLQKYLKELETPN